jgi:hypothetical protein
MSEPGLQQLYEKYIESLLAITSRITAADTSISPAEIPKIAPEVWGDDTHGPDYAAILEHLADVGNTIESTYRNRDNQPREIVTKD